MATWSGWVVDLLNAARLPVSADNQTFVADWGNSEKTNCTNNPVVISHQTRRSTDCKKLTSTRTAQNYETHAEGASAFSSQLHSGNFPHLLAALRSGLPYNVDDAHDVIADLVLWGAAAFAFELQQNYGPPTPTGGGGGGDAKAAHAHKGWADIRRSVNHGMPTALAYSQRTTHAALRRLGHARKVRG